MENGFEFEEDDIRAILEPFIEYLEEEFYDDEIYGRIMMKPMELREAIDNFLEQYF